MKIILGLGLGLHRHSSSPPPTPPPFAPSSLSGLTLWLDASDTATITQVSGSVSQWDDKTANNYHVTQSSGTSQPKTGTRTLNALNVLNFDGSNDKLVMASAVLPTVESDNTLFILCATDTPSKSQQYMINGINSNPNSRYRMAYLAGGTQYEVLNGTTSVSGSYTVDANPHIHILRKESATVHGVIDGVSIASGAAGTNGIVAMAIGTQANNVANAYDGCIGEVIWYNRALSNDEVNEVGTYLAAKWGGAWTMM